MVKYIVTYEPVEIGKDPVIEDFVILGWRAGWKLAPPCAG